MAKKKITLLKFIVNLLTDVINAPGLKTTLQHALNTAITGALVAALAWLGWAPKQTHNHPRPDRHIPAASSTQIPGR